MYDIRKSVKSVCFQSRRNQMQLCVDLKLSTSANPCALDILQNNLKYFLIDIELLDNC